MLALCLVAALGAGVLTATRLEFHSDRSDLVDPELDWNQRYADYRTRFPHWRDLIVVIEGDADDVRIDALARRAGAAVAALPEVESVVAGFAPDAGSPRLFRALPETEFEDRLAQLAALRRLAAAEHAGQALAAALQLAGTGGVPGGPDVAAILAPLLDALHGRAIDLSGVVAYDAWTPLISPTGSGRQRLMLVATRVSEGGIDGEGAALAAVRATLAETIVGAEPAVSFGVTGVPALEADETRQSVIDSTEASIAAFVLITLLMLVVFRGILVPLLVAASLLIGIALSFGWLVLAVGHLQLLSVTFTVILLGLGVDFALHLIARLELLRDSARDLPDAMEQVFRGVGPGLLTGALTTAAAFGSTAFTDFRGMAEMGIIAAGGIILCLVAVLCFLPAALAVTGRWRRSVRARPGGTNGAFMSGRLDWIDRRPGAALVLAATGAAALSLPGLGVRYDPDVLALQAPDVESVVWEHRLVADDDASVWSAVVLAPPDAAGPICDRLRALPEVADVAAMGTILHADRVPRAVRVERQAREPVAPLPIAPGARPLLGLVDRILATEGLDAALATPLREARRAYADATLAERDLRWERLNAAWAELRPGLRATAEAAFEPGPLGAEDLPPSLRRRWTAADGAWLLTAQPAVDPLNRPILAPERLGPFVEAIRTVAPSVLGPPVQILESTRLIVRAYLHAALWAITAILVLLVIDFRSIADALCALVPVTAGFGGMFGLMALGDVPLNFANIIVMPLIFGIGVDGGVHVVHRWRLEPTGRPAGLSGGTGRGITLTLVTTMIGFGSMAVLAEHRGVRSLGYAMTAGLAVTMLACWLLLPPILRLRSREADA